MNNRYHQFKQTITPVDLAKARNTQQVCKARGCNESRSGLNAYCTPHQVVYRRYGHPHAGNIRIQSYMPYRQHVSAILEANSTHPGMVSALDYVTQYMARAAQSDEAFKGAPEISRLVRHGVTPRDFLIELCSFWCYLHDHPRALPDTRSEDFGLSRAVMHLAPRPRRVTREAEAKGLYGYSMKPKFSALDSIGSHFRSVLAFFLVNMAEAVSTRDARAIETVKQLRAPLVTPTAVYLAEQALKATAATAAPALPFDHHRLSAK